MAASFRQINVDQYDEDRSINAKDLIPQNPLSTKDLISTVNAIAQQVRSFLQRGDTPSALSAVLSVHPYGADPSLDQAKVMKLVSLTVNCRLSILLV
jgi:ARP2/3 complex 16 kDa subunit (p16-Arc)